VTSHDPPATVVVHLDGKSHTVPWPRGEKLLDVLLAAGIEAPYSCREGHCGACATTKVNGEVTMEANDVLDAEDLAEGLILACQSRPRSEEVEVSYDD
jgi:3-ketosteroid 9alpha-monooxygenase subunit B